jgi:hypothetical protein
MATIYPDTGYTIGGTEFTLIDNTVDNTQFVDEFPGVTLGTFWTDIDSGGASTVNDALLLHVPASGGLSAVRTTDQYGHFDAEIVYSYDASAHKYHQSASYTIVRLSAYVDTNNWVGIEHGLSVTDGQVLQVVRCDGGSRSVIHTQSAKDQQRTLRILRNDGNLRFFTGGKLVYTLTGWRSASVNISIASESVDPIAADIDVSVSKFTPNIVVLFDETPAVFARRTTAARIDGLTPGVLLPGEYQVSAHGLYDDVVSSNEFTYISYDEYVLSNEQSVISVVGDDTVRSLINQLPYLSPIPIGEISSQLFVSGSGVAGGVAFWDGTSSVTSDATNFYWNNTTNRLGIGNAAPTTALDVTGTVTATAVGATTVTATTVAATTATVGVYNGLFNQTAGSVHSLSLQANAGQGTALRVYAPSGYPNSSFEFFETSDVSLTNFNRLMVNTNYPVATAINFVSDFKGTGTLRDMVWSTGNNGTATYVERMRLTASTGAFNVVGTLTAGNLSGTNTGDVSLTAIGGTPNANGASISSQAINLQPASASYGGVLTTGAQTLAGGKAGAVTALTSSTNSIAIDLAVNNNFSHTFTENTTLASPSNPVAGQSGIIMFTQHASSPKTLAVNSFWKFGGGTPTPLATATNSAIDALAYVVAPGATYAICNIINDIKT